MLLRQTSYRTRSIPLNIIFFQALVAALLLPRPGDEGHSTSTSVGTSTTQSSAPRVEGSDEEDIGTVTPAAEPASPPPNQQRKSSATNTALTDHG